MEPDYGYIKENHQSYAQRLALKAGCNAAELIKDLTTTCAMRFEDVPNDHNITLLQPAFSAKRAPNCTGFGMNDSGSEMKAVRTTCSFPDSEENDTTFRTYLRELQ